MTIWLDPAQPLLAIFFNDFRPIVIGQRQENGITRHEFVIFLQAKFRVKCMKWTLDEQNSVSAAAWQWCWEVTESCMLQAPASTLRIHIWAIESQFSRMRFSTSDWLIIDHICLNWKQPWKCSSGRFFYNFSSDRRMMLFFSSSYNLQLSKDSQG